VPFYFPFLFFLLFHAFPFRFPWFLYCRLYIFMYIHSSTVSKESVVARTQFPLRFRPRSHSGPLDFVPIQPAHLGATPPNFPLLLRTRLAPFAPRHAPATAIVCLFWARPAVCKRIIGILSAPFWPWHWHTN